jgi:hypothetical protein
MANRPRLSASGPCSPFFSPADTSIHRPEPRRTATRGPAHGSVSRHVGTPGCIPRRLAAPSSVHPLALTLAPSNKTNLEPPLPKSATAWGIFPLPVHHHSRGVEEKGTCGEELEPSRRCRVALSATVPAGMPGAIAPKTMSRSHCRLFKRRPSTPLKPCTTTHAED